MKQIIFLAVVMCFSLTGLMAQKNPLNYVRTDGTFVKNGKAFRGENLQKEREQNSGSRSSGCPGCDPTWFIIPAQQGCPNCKEELVPGPAFKQFIELKALDTTQWSILEYSVFKLTFCQNDQMELVVENGVPSDDGIVWGKEGSNIRSKEFTLEPDQFYLFEVILKSKDPDCPSWMRHQTKESFYVGLGCESGGNITVNVVSQRNTVIENQKGEKITVSKTDTSVLNVNQPVSTFTKVYNDTLLVNVTPDTIQKIQNVTDTLVMQLSSVTTSTNEQQGFENLEIYPNPVMDELNIDLRGEKAEINLFDQHGKLIDSKEIDTFGKIDLSQQISGIYILQAKAMIGGKLHLSVKKISKL
jgi:Secretion system C-terminal sorting domain